MTKRVTIERDIVSEVFGGQRIAQLDGIDKWYMWLDYFCVPQLVRGFLATGEEQLLHIKSIPSYVELCSVFVALVPPALHNDTQAACNIHSWLQWEAAVTRFERAEAWGAKALSVQHEKCAPFHELLKKCMGEWRIRQGCA